MKEQDVSELCRQVNQVVKQAVDYAQSPQFQNNIQRGVEKTVNGVRNTVETITNSFRQNQGQGPYQGQPPYQGQQSYRGGNYRQRVGRPGRPVVYPNYNAPQMVRPQPGMPQVAAMPRQSRGGGYFVLGGICTFLFGAMALSMLTGFFTAPGKVITQLGGYLISLGLYGGGACASFLAGVRRRGLFNRRNRYWQVLQGRVVCPLAELAASVGRPKEFVVKDMQKMANKRYLPVSYLDAKGEAVILGYQAYQKYLQEEHQREAARLKAEEENKKRPPEVNEMLREGFEYIRQIREANDAIPGVEVSEKLQRLEEVTAKIFVHVEHHPNKLPEIRKFMQYYLPTTLKLVGAYREFEEQSLEGENINQTKREICDTLDTINIAFANLLDSLFEDDAMDVSADITVLQAMFAQEGLTGHDFKRSNEPEKQEKPKENPNIPLE